MEPYPPGEGRPDSNQPGPDQELGPPGAVYGPSGVIGGGTPTTEARPVVGAGSGMGPGRPGKRRSPADAGSPGSRRIALLLAVVAAVLAIGWQNLPEPVQMRLVGAEPEVEAPRETVVTPMGEFDLIARLEFKLGWVMRSLDPKQAGAPLAQVEQVAHEPGERVVVEIMRADLVGPERALERVERIAADLAEAYDDATQPEAAGADEQASGDDERAVSGAVVAGHAYGELEAEAIEALLRDVDTLRVIWRDGLDAAGEAELDRLKTRYGYFGKVATTYGLADDEDAPGHDTAVSLRSGGWALIVLLSAFGIVGTLAFLAGLVLLVFGVVRIGSGKWKPIFVPPERGGSACLEVYGLFVGAFFLLIVGTGLAQAHLKAELQPAVFLGYLALQWSLILIPLVWIKLRGGDVRGPLGLFAVKGVWREVGWGFVMYLASLPLFAAGVAMTFVLMMIKEALFPSAEPPSNPVLEMVGGANPVLLLLLASLVCVWAPLCEEMVFRGALFRHMRSRMGFFGAGLCSALLFAAMHSYGPLMLTPLIVLGFMFAFMRETRGSLIPSITAHFVHNTTILAVVATMVWLVSD